MKTSDFTGDFLLKDFIRQKEGTQCIYTLAPGFRAQQFQELASSYAYRIGARLGYESKTGTFARPTVQVRLTLVAQGNPRQKRGAPAKKQLKG